jgi:hypothetical protein
VTVVVSSVAELFHPYPHHRVSATASATAPPLTGGGVRVAECGCRHPYSRIFRIFRIWALCGSCGKGKREPTNHGPNVPGLSTGAKRLCNKLHNRTTEARRLP